MLEIGSLGHFEPNATRALSDAFLLSKQEANQVLMKLSRIAVSCSYHIFNARLCSTWDANKPVCSCSLVFFVLPHSLSCSFLLVSLPCQAHHSSVLVSCCPRLHTCTSFTSYVHSIYVHLDEWCDFRFWAQFIRKPVKHRVMRSNFNP